MAIEVETNSPNIWQTELPMPGPDDHKYHRGYVESIDELSLKMLKTSDLDNAEDLNLELKEMTKELREL